MTNTIYLFVDGHILNQQEAPVVQTLWSALHIVLGNADAGSEFIQSPGMKPAKGVVGKNDAAFGA